MKFPLTNPSGCARVSLQVSCARESLFVKWGGCREMASTSGMGNAFNLASRREAFEGTQ